MDWSDEHYVKLYTRDTATWLLLPWQSRALLMMVMRKLDKAGVLDLGRDVERALAAVVMCPIKFVRDGLPALLKEGTLKLVDGRLIAPKFLDAQETRKTHVQSSREHREKKKALALRQVLELPTPPRDGACQSVTSGDPPSPALPVPSPLKDLSRKKPRERLPKREKPPDPRHAETVKALYERYPQHFFLGVNAGKDAKAVERLLTLGDTPEIVARVGRALSRNDFPRTRTLSELVSNWPHFATDSPSPIKGRVEPGDFSNVKAGLLGAGEW